jgi:hypothetical protein
MNRFLAKLKIFFLAHVFNPPWLSRDARRAWRYKIIVSVTTKYLKRYLPTMALLSKPNTAGEKIYTAWLQGEDAAPQLVKSCWASIRKHCKQPLVILDEKSMMDMIDLPECIMAKQRAGKIRPAHFADIARVELLYKYGGFWMDATLYATGPISNTVENSDFFVFVAGEGAVWGYGGFQNFFIRAKPGSYLLAAWREMILSYWKNEDAPIDYLMHQLMFKTLIENDPRAKIEFEKMPKINMAPSHQLWWKYRDQPFDQKAFDQMGKDAFFQKTTYRGESAKNPIPGSFADFVINKDQS